MEYTDFITKYDSNMPGASTGGPTGFGLFLDCLKLDHSEIIRYWRLAALEVSTIGSATGKAPSCLTRSLTSMMDF